MSWKPPSQQAESNVPTRINRPPTSYKNYFNDNIEPNFQATSRPKNLSNSVARQLIKENGIAGKKEVIWPPPSDDYEIIDEFRQNGHYEAIPHRTLMIKKEKKPFEPPPQYMPLLETAPLVQNSSPVYIAEPVAQTFHGGARSVRDQQWPPPEYKNRAEVRPYVNISQTSEFGPRKATKDHSGFFARNTLPSSYSAYKPPPDTQHYWE